MLVPNERQKDIIIEHKLPAQPVPEKTRKARGKTTYPAGRTLMNGDCFYSAIFRAAKKRESSVLENLGKCLEITITSESKFIQAFRNKLGTYIEGGNLPTGSGREGQLNTYDVFIEMIGGNGGENYRERVSSVS